MDCPHCDTAAPLEVLPDGRGWCPTCARVTPAPESGPPAAQEAAGRDTTPALDLAALRAVRGPGGRFTAGVPGPRLRHGLRASTLMLLPDLAEAHAERVQAITRDLGSDLSAVQAPLVSELARLQIITDSLGGDVIQHGTMTSKGRTRAAVTLYLSVLDRQQRLAQVLGLQRQTKPAGTSIVEWAKSEGER